MPYLMGYKYQYKVVLLHNIFSYLSVIAKNKWFAIIWINDIIFLELNPER